MAHDFDLSLAARLSDVADPAAAIAAQWEAVHEAAAAVGILAQLGAERPDETLAGWPQRIAAQPEPKRTLAMRGVDDLAAVMEPGLRALLSMTAQGRDTTSAALTLWREFHSARAALIALVPAE